MTNWRPPLIPRSDREHKTTTLKPDPRGRSGLRYFMRGKGPRQHLGETSPMVKQEVRKVRVVLEVIALTDREEWEYGEALARAFNTELNEDYNATFGPITVECTEAEAI